MEDHVPDASATPRFGCLVALVMFMAVASLVACSPGDASPSRSPPVASDLDPGVVGSSKGKTYHRATCEWAQKVSPRNRLRFAGEEAAVKKGYGPCRTCITK